jgi:hypothetical protein
LVRTADNQRFFRLATVVRRRGKLERGKPMSVPSPASVALSRRRFVSATGSAFAALLASGCMTRGAPIASLAQGFSGYGPLRPDPAGMLDLP